MADRLASPRQARIEGRRVGLTVREFEVLKALSESCGKVVTREQIYARVWRGALEHYRFTPELIASEASSFSRLLYRTLTS